MVATKNKIAKAGLLVILAAGLSGCYSNWPELSALADKISCDMTVKEIKALGLKYQASNDWDAQTNNLTLAKHDDAIAVVFKEDNKEIIVIAKTKSEISFGGLIRRKGEVEIVKRCKP